LLDLVSGEKYIDPTYLIASQEEVLNIIPEWTDSIEAEKETKSADNNKLVTL